MFLCDNEVEKRGRFRPNLQRSQATQHIELVLCNSFVAA